jgi:membrane-bound serine protease (ClpP class)
MVTQSKSFSAREALEKGLIDFLVTESQSLAHVIHGKKIKLAPAALPKTLNTENARVIRSEMSLGQKLLHVLANPNLATLLITLGTLCLYVEISTPGLSFPGIFGSICLIVGFVSFQMLPIRFGALALILLGLAFVIAEFFVTTHGALALGGTLAFILGLLWVMDPSATSLTVSPSIWIPAALVLGLASFSAMWVARRLKQSVKDALSQIGGGGALGLAGYPGVLEKDGKALIRGEVWDVGFEDPSLEKQYKPGDRVEVVRVEGFRVIVRKA